MASARVIVSLLWTLPLGAVVALTAWAFADFLAIPNPRVAEEFALAALIGLAGIALGIRYRVAVLRRGGLILIVASYLAAHLLVVPMVPAAALGYVTLALLAAELRILADRFAPIFAAKLGEEDRSRVGEALQRASLRIAAATGVAFLGSYLAADLAFAGTVPATSIASALVLSVTLIVIVLVLALWPIVERRLGWEAVEEPAIQTPK